MTPPKKEKFVAQVPQLDLAEMAEMLTDFSREAQRHLISARNSLLVLESVPSDKEAVENIFKTFHTIKGLADFLKLRDICSLTQEAETMMDMTRKDFLPFEGRTVELTAKAIDSLQKLMELLDEQISNDGQLKRSYHDVSRLISSIRTLTSKQATLPKPTKAAVTALPTIHFEPDMSVCSQISDKLASIQGDVTLDHTMLEKIVNDFRETSRSLKEAQSKLQERQRELIKERTLAMKLTQQAQSEARAKSEYLANMSHEIRTLINAILGFTEIIREGPLSEKQREHLNTIILSGKMLLGIVNHILDFSKVESGKLKLESIDFNLEYIIEEVFKIIRTRLVGKPINLYFDIKEDVPREVMGDPTRLKQIFINLLDNAIKFTEKGEIGLEVVREEKPASLPNQHVLRFTVWDTGIGIPSDKRDVIFESFMQASDSTTRLYGGTGLGLALCRMLVEKMGGHISVESEVGKGSRFIFTLQLPEGKISGKKADASALSGFAGTGVMIVECHANSAKTLSAICEKFSLNVLPVTRSAKQATELLLKCEVEAKALPTIIFIDTMLPSKEGFMLAYKIRQQEHYRKIKLVALSSDVKADGSAEFKQSGFDVFLTKPLIKGEVADTIRRLLGGKLPEARVLSHDMLNKISCEGIRILVAEDSAPNQELLKVHFETLGCKCDYANNGQEAIDKLKQNKYDICFMDLQMPVMGGLKATKIIRDELKLNVPIVALTAAEFQEEKDKCYEVGMSDYLAKPFGLDELKEKIIKCAKI